MKHTFLRALCLLCALVLMGTLTLTGCSSEEPATKEPSATENDAHDHHGEETPATKKHDHKEPAAMGLACEKEEGDTFTLVIKDCEGAVVFKKAGLTKKAISKELGTGIVELAWVTSNNPGGYECLYINRLTCQVSDMIAGEQATDGNRIVYSEIRDGKLNVIVRDLFDKNGYAKVTEMKDAYTAGEYTVLGTVMMKNNQVKVSYLVNKDGAHRIVTFDLYEKDEKPANTTEKTTKKK